MVVIVVSEEDVAVNVVVNAEDSADPAVVVTVVSVVPVVIDLPVKVVLPGVRAAIDVAEDPAVLVEGARAGTARRKTARSLGSLPPSSVVL